MTSEQFDALVADVAKRGVIQPVVVHDGKIIDGRHRWLACEKLGCACPTVEWTGGAESAVEHVVALNASRRHMTPGQRACVAVDLLPHLEIEAKQRQGARTDLVAGLPQSANGGGRSRDRAAAALGVSARYVSQAKRLKRDDPQAFEQVRAGACTLAEAKRRRHERARQQRREDNQRKIDRCPSMAAVFGTDAKFSTIVVDPPWDYASQNLLDRGMMDYATMPLAEIAALPVADMADDDSHCYLWATNRMLADAHDVLAAWEFSYRSMLTWCKPGLGMGTYFRSTTEHVLFAVRGSQPLLRHNCGTWFHAARKGHSVKPDAFYGLVESCSPGPYLELFGRLERPGWAVWGEVSSEIHHENDGLDP